MRARLLQWVVFLGLLSALGPARARVGVPCRVAFASGSPSPSTEDQWKLRPIKKRVGRAVTPTIDKIDNMWFVVSQIVIPLSAIIFSLLYVRRYRAKHACASADTPNSYGGEAAKHEQPESRDRGGG